VINNDCVFNFNTFNNKKIQGDSRIKFSFSGHGIRRLRNEGKFYCGHLVINSSIYIYAITQQITEE